jgi:hypothetical protein
VQDIPRDACRSRAIPSAAAGLEKDEEDPSSSSSSTMCIDATYSSQVPITEPYCFHPNFMESRSHQRQRMKQVAETVIEPGNTIVAVSHGGPVTHLYGKCVHTIGSCKTSKQPFFFFFFFFHSAHALYECFDFQFLVSLQMCYHFFWVQCENRRIDGESLVHTRGIDVLLLQHLHLQAPSKQQQQ